MENKVVNQENIEWFSYKNGKLEKISIKPLSKNELSYLNTFLQGKIDSNTNRLYKICNRLHASFISFNNLRKLDTDPLKREPPFVLLGTADLGLYKSDPLEAVLSQIDTEQGYGNKLGELLYQNKRIKLPYLNPQKGVFAISVRKIKEPIEEHDQNWHKAELKETQGLDEVSFAALVSGKKIGLSYPLLIILLGVTDGVSKDGTVIEVTQRKYTFKTIIKKRIKEEKITQANIYSVLLGAKKWHCVFYCRNGRFIIKGKPDVDKALNDIRKGTEARVKFKLSNDPVYSNFSKNFGWPLNRVEYNILVNGIKIYGSEFVNSMENLSELRKYGFSVSNICDIYKFGIKNVDEITLQLLQDVESTIKNGFSKMIFQQALCKWAGENNIPYLDVKLLKSVISDNPIFYDIEYYNQLVILYGFSEKGKIIQFKAEDTNEVIKYIIDKLKSKSLFVAYGNQDKIYINRLLEENLTKFIRNNFMHNQVDVSKVFLRGYALNSGTKGLYDVASKLIPEGFKENTNTFNILELVNEYISLKQELKNYSKVFDSIKIKNKNDLIALEAIYKKLKELIVNVKS